MWWTGSGPERCVTGNVVARGTFRLSGTEEHVLDQAGFDAGAVDRALDGMTGHGNAVGVIQAPTVGFGHTRTGVRNDNGFTHGIPSSNCSDCCGAP